jgi:hypothetical protein
MALNIFGFQFKRAKTQPEQQAVSFVTPQYDDGAVNVVAGGAYGTYVDMEGSARTEAELVTKYREMSQHPEIDAAISDIVDEAMVSDGGKLPVELDLESLNISDNIKAIFAQEFNTMLELLEFNTKSYDIFRRWYVDGRLLYHVIIDDASPTNGIKELRYIDPRKIRKVRELRRKPVAGTGITVNQTEQEYYIFNERGFQNQVSAISTSVGSMGIRISPDSIIHCTSGVMDKNNQLVLGFMHKAIKPLNQLRALEDAVVIYKISRAPERRIFYIDVGNLPKMKAEQYLRDIMTRFKNRVVYDSATGEIRDDRKFMTMLEDFWLPRREGGKGTEIDTLPAGQLAGDMDDVKYFQRALYKSLNVPINRLEPDNTYAIGRATEITRDEVRFTKFISRLQDKFSQLLSSILEKQLILKRVITPEEWDQIKTLIRFKYTKDNQFTELKNIEMMKERLNVLQVSDAYVGKYYSVEWIRKNVLQQTENDMAEINNQINNEIKQGVIQLAPPEDTTQKK